MKKDRYKRYRDILKWLLKEMPLDKPFNVDNEQRIILMDIFALSELKVPTEPTDGYQYYFKIENDYKLITKVRYYE